MAKNIQINIQTSDSNYEVLYPQTLGSLVSGEVSQATQATNATNATNATTADSAIKLSTARNLKVSLGSTSTQSFDGSNDATSIGVSGTLPVNRGGTGTTSLSSLASSLSSYFTFAHSIYGSRVGNGTTEYSISLGFRPRIFAISRYKGPMFPGLAIWSADNNKIQLEDEAESLACWFVDNTPQSLVLSKGYNKGFTMIWIETSSSGLTIKTAQDATNISICNANGITFYYTAIG